MSMNRAAVQEPARWQAKTVAGARDGARAAPSRLGEQVLPGLVGRCLPMRRLAAMVGKLAAVRVAVLLRGESGTGKELVAQALHRRGPRAGGPFVAINGATVSGELGASALFGHSRGAFTGATCERQGAFRQANGGTLLVDEVAALPPQAQAALLRVVEEGTVLPVGADRPVPVDVRLVTATCEPLEDLVRKRLFRPDLYQRLAVCVLRVPALRERAADLGLLTRHLLVQLRMGPTVIEQGAIELLRGHSFPGNVRELRNMLTQAALRADGDIVRVADMAAVMDERLGGRRRLRPEDARALVDRTGGNVSEGARRAGMPRSTFRDLLRLEAPGPKVAAAS